MGVSRYKPGDSTADGHVVKQVLGWSQTCVFFCAVDGEYGWEYDVDEDKIDPAKVMSKHDTLQAIVDARAFEDEALHEDLELELARALFNALSADDESSAFAHFSDVERKIIRLKSARESRAIRLFVTILIGSASALLLFFTAWSFAGVYLGQLFDCAAMGTVGASFSILQRETKHKPEVHFLRYTILESWIRCTTGACAGAIFMLALKSNLVFGLLADNYDASLVFGVIAGFSERFVPNALSSVEGGRTEVDMG